MHKKYYLTPILIFISYSLVAQPLNRKFESANGSVNLLGLVTLDALKADPFGTWFEEYYLEYDVDTTIVRQIALPDSITIFMGTWCGDSRREVPRFIKMLEVAEFDLTKLKIICLNTGFQNYKQAPEREERGVDIHRVPTFIFHDDKQEEIGRIVEEPVVSLEQDVRDILEGKSYETYYPVANDLIEKFKNHSLKELKKMMPLLVKEYANMSVNAYELNTYGYVLWSSFDLMKAELVFELNRKLYPDMVIPYSVLTMFKENLGKNKEAISYAKKGLVIDAENKNLLAALKSLEEQD